MLLQTLPHELHAQTDIDCIDDGVRFNMTIPLVPEVLGHGPA
jgi:hypothetical protein